MKGSKGMLTTSKLKMKKFREEMKFFANGKIVNPTKKRRHANLKIDAYKK